MTPAVKGAIEAFERIADKLSDTPFDPEAQLAKHYARLLADEYLMAKPSEAERILQQIRRLVR